MKNISNLNLTNNSLNSKALSEFAQICKSLPKLKCLDLSYNGIGDKSGTCLKDIMQNCPSLTQLSLKSCCLTNDFVTNQDISLFCQLTSVDLSYNRLGVIGIMELVSVLKSSEVLKRVQVNGCIKNSTVSDEEKLVELFLSLQDSTQNHLEIIAFKQNKRQVGNKY